uniref:(California timema) hypothetical protein n=1 Tax=Timema californicum TaxID=61474 RepID=A0A7R9PFS9_TIMCA|nr:unnamed protein product [Timema californicum]
MSINTKKSALTVLKNVHEDSELRIKAYLAAVQCPCGSLANALKDLLEAEQINQGILLPIIDASFERSHAQKRAQRAIQGPIAPCLPSKPVLTGKLGNPITLATFH